MRENPLGGKAGHANQEVQARADRDDAATAPASPFSPLINGQNFWLAGWYAPFLANQRNWKVIETTPGGIGQVVRLAKMYTIN
jgi:hypothetical protein